MIFAVINQSKAPDSAVANLCEGAAIHADIFVQEWDLGSAQSLLVRPGVVSDKQDADTIVILITDTLDEQNAIAYHTISGSHPQIMVGYGEIPDGVLFRDEKGTGASLIAAIQHEIVETLADRYCNSYAIGPLIEKDAHGRTVSHPLVAMESADPVQSFAFPITLQDGTEVDGTDFVLPRWFLHGAEDGAKYDHMGILKKPLTIAPGGYAIVIDGSRLTPSQVFAKRVYHETVAPDAWRMSLRSHRRARTWRRLGGGGVLVQP